MQTKSILILAFLFIMPLSWSQTKAEIDAYIAKKGDFLSIQEAGAKDKNLEKAMPLIQNWIKEQQQEITDFYTNLDGFSFKNDQLSVPLYHIVGFKRAYQMDQQKKQENGTIEPYSSSQWKNGNLLIDLKNMHVLNYQNWE